MKSPNTPQRKVVGSLSAMQAMVRQIWFVSAVAA
jgi:hypothetical protein